MICKTYAIIPGEPQLGRVKECNVILDKEDVATAIADALESDLYLHPGYKVEANGVTFEIGEYLSQQDLYEIQRDIEEKFLDNEFGDQKFLDYLYSKVEDKLPNEPFEYDFEEYM